MNEKIHLNTLRFDLSPETRATLTEVLSDLLQTKAEVARVDATFEGEYQRNTEIIYHVTLRAQSQDAVLFELKQGRALLPTVRAATAALRSRLSGTRQPFTV